jgi:hypothetical protein
MDITDCCELWVEYCYRDNNGGVKPFRPELFIKNWYFASSDPDCDMNQANEIFKGMYDEVINQVTITLTPRIEELLEPLNWKPCDETGANDNVIFTVTAASCVSDPYRTSVAIDPERIKIVNKVSKCTSESGFCKYGYSLCLQPDENGNLVINAILRFIEKSSNGYGCPAETTIIEFEGDPGITVNCNVVCE